MHSHDRASEIPAAKSVGSGPRGPLSAQARKPQELPRDKKPSLGAAALKG
jgi:hypothetical protein